MIFERRQRIERITLEGRKAAAFRRRQARELERYPLLAAEIADTQIGIEEAEVRRNEIAQNSERILRDFSARVWKECRRDYFASDETTKESVRVMWSAWTGPNTCVYFRYVVDRCTGEHERRTEAANRMDRAASRAMRELINQPTLDLECAENLTRNTAP